MKIKLLTTALLLSLTTTSVFAQEKLTREQILSMSTEQLSELPLEDLMAAVETLGVSSVDELFAMIMNKNVSSASKREENAFTSPLSTTVITNAEMKTYGVTTIEEALRLIPGMIVTEKTNGMYDVQMRGLSNIPDNNLMLYTENANTLLMIDGRPVQNYAMAAICFDQLPISIVDINRIEVVRGACGALYGANAVSGVINIITEKPSKDGNNVTGTMQMGNETNIGEIALRKSFGDKIALGLTLNMQYRERGTDKLYVMPNDNLYSIDDKALMNTKVDAADFGAFMMSHMTPKAEGGWMTIDEIDHMVNINMASSTTPQYVASNAIEPETTLRDMFPNSRISRKTMGANGYVTVTPTNDIRFDLSGGYQNSYATTTAFIDDIFSMNTRTSKTYYVNLTSNIKDLSINASWNAGPQNFVVGTPAFKIYSKVLNADIAYDVKIGDLSIRPAINYQWNNYKDYMPVYNSEDPKATGDYTWSYYKDHEKMEGNKRLFGFFDGEATIKTIAPSIRLDYKIGDLRLTGAFRSDKTSIPDKWNHSWQLSTNYEINDRNFVRLVYGRANRGACLTNTSAKYQWRRTNMTPELMVFNGSEDAGLVKIDNIELGYRLRPIDRILIDAELYYSHSDGYGALMSKETAQIAEGMDIAEWLGAALPQYLMTGGAMSGDYEKLHSIFSPRVDIEYKELPFKVNQYGLGINIDWIITNKLIAKVNANVQQTRIDDYYKYSQTEAIVDQLTRANILMEKGLYSGKIIEEFAKIYMQTGKDPSKVLGFAAVNAYMAKTNYKSKSPEEQAEIIKNFYDAGIKGESYDGVDNPLTMFFALQYSVRFNKETNQYFMGSSEYIEPEHSNNHKHKATPTAYGMVGLTYKPLPQLELATFGNFTGKRTYVTSYGTAELDNRFTMNLKASYKPMDKLELFFNAHNLFDTEDREFIYSDKIGGIYTVGVSFNL